MKLAACVVLYNPDKSILGNIRSFLPFVEKVVAVDNSETRWQAYESVVSVEKIDVVSMGGNKGIASALNVGCSRLINEGFDVVLTMDQDSIFPLEDAESILREVETLIGAYSIVGLNFNSTGSGEPSEIVETKYWLTSGNFVDLRAFERTGGFDSRLFIDYVDIEFGHKLKLAGLKVCYLKNFSLSHFIGNPIEVRLFGKTFYAMNHPPIRYYYRYRNSRFLYGTDRRFYKSKYYHEILVNIPKMLLFEPCKIEKLRMLFRGLSDGRRGRLGPYSEGSQDE